MGFFTSKKAKPNPKPQKKPKKPNVLHSVSDGNTGERSTTVWGKKKR